MPNPRQQVEDFMNNLSEAEKSKLVSSFKDGIDSLISINAKKLADLTSEIEEMEIEERELWEIQRNEKHGEVWRSTMEKRQAISVSIKEKKEEAVSIKNSLKALENGGSYSSISDRKGKEHEEIPDFRKVDSNYISFDEENILIDKQPGYIPIINEEDFRAMGYVFDAIRIEKDSYLLSINKYKYLGKDEKNQFVILTLDQLILTLDYYYTKAKALNKKEAADSNERAEQRWDEMSDDKKIRYLMQSNAYYGLPAKKKKTISKEDYNALDWKEREKIHKFFKTRGAKRLKSKLENNSMWVSFHEMYERFIDPTAVAPKKGYANSVVFAYWANFREMMEFKIKDIKIQRQDLSETYAQAIETSFGESNTETTLKDKFGILIKRQNGDKINLEETVQIEEAWGAVQRVFGDLKPNAIKYNIKVSHSGKRMIFASKAIGVYVSRFGTIGVSNKYGDMQFKSTMSHEIGHFIDNVIGELNGKRYATDDYESTAGKIAFSFRNSMNLSKEAQSDYINSTKECFARAMQQHFMIQHYGYDEAVVNFSYTQLDRTIPIVNLDDFVSKEKYESIIKPLVLQFLKENNDVLKTTVDVDGSENISNLADGNNKDLIDALKLLLDVDTKGEVKKLIKTLEEK